MECERQRRGAKLVLAERALRHTNGGSSRSEDEAKDRREMRDSVSQQQMLVIVREEDAWGVGKASWLSKRA